ncbi:hypothetical protein EC957_008885 [Mortierella hygrophila]|uniref:Crinkler effector protein N-terminal domain-containing protein n=1 Tax=Mortierella hygrophila TaxID=979708 RepID=A0A9P6JXF1_9FUNG|nr:hypothetical protein EC957_008885 [Mortierella hygrophila]
MKIFCLVHGETTSSIFTVVASPDDVVSDLKKLIRTEKTNAFSDIDADKLILWRVSIPDDDDDDDDERPILIDNVPEKKKLKATTKLSKVFDADLPEDTIHIIVHRPPSGPDDKDVQEPRLRTILKMYVQEGLKGLVLRVDFPQKGFSKFSVADVLRRLDVEKLENIAELPVGRTPCDTEERREVLGLLNGSIELARRSSKFVNEACCTRYAGPYFQAAVALNPELCLTPEREISGRWGSGPVDYGIEWRNVAGWYVSGVAEVKTSKTYETGFPQNVIQLDAALTGRDARGPQNQSKTLVSYGVVTDAKQWELVECRLEPMNALGTFQPPPVIRRKVLDVIVDYDNDNWRDAAQEVFEHILWFVEKMSEEILLTEDAPSTKRSRGDDNGIKEP